MIHHISRAIRVSIMPMDRHWQVGIFLSCLISGEGKGQADHGLRDDGLSKTILSACERKDLTMAKQKKKLPDMQDWSDERVAEFWETHDSTEYLDEMQGVDVKVDVPDCRVISLRLEKEDIEKAKVLAQRKGLSYTALFRLWIKEKLAGSKIKV